MGTIKALFEQARELDAKPDQTINMCDICMPR